MKRSAWLIAAGAVAFTLGAAPVLRADPPATSSAAAPRASHSAHDGKRLRERLERWRDQVPSGLASSFPVPSASGSSAWQPELARRWAELAKTRQDRRDKHRAALVRDVGARLQDPAVRAELAQHAQRVAELGRLEFLAKNARAGEQREQLLGRIQKLQAKESARHERRMAQLAPPASSAAPAPSASGGPPP